MLIGTDTFCSRKCSGNKHFQVFILMNLKRWKSWNDSCLWQIIKWVFPCNLSRKRLFKVVQSFVLLHLGYESGINMNLVSFLRKHRILPVFVRTRAWLCVRETYRQTDRQTERAFRWLNIVSCLRCCNKMLNSDKTMDFTRFGERPVSESAASESGSSDIWKMNCIDSFQASFPD